MRIRTRTAAHDVDGRIVVDAGPRGSPGAGINDWIHDGFRRVVVRRGRRSCGCEAGSGSAWAAARRREGACRAAVRIHPRSGLRQMYASQYRATTLPHIPQDRATWMASAPSQAAYSPDSLLLLRLMIPLVSLTSFVASAFFLLRSRSVACDAVLRLPLGVEAAGEASTAGIPPMPPSSDALCEMPRLAAASAYDTSSG